MMGRNGGRQIHTSENNCGSRKARRRSVSARRQSDYGLLRPTISGCTRSQPDGNPAEDFPQDGLGALRILSGAFEFSDDDVDKPISALPGGERSRVAMARMLYNPPNFLVLYEPTNHLDRATKDMLVEALQDFEGTMIFVSHDRTFLVGLSSRVLEIGGESGTSGQPVRSQKRVTARYAV